MFAGAFSELSNLALLDFAIQWVMWAYSAYHQTEKFYDITGSCTYVALIVLSYLSNRTPNVRQMVQTGMVLVWAIRLGSYLFARISNDGMDRRFDGVRDNPPKFLIFWTLQGVWVLVTLLPSLLVNLSQAKKDAEAINMRDYLGWTLWIIGFAFEALADYQKSQFRANPDNKGKFINTGLWSISRHPNYFGEILMWFALYINSTNVLSGWKAWACLLCPLFDVWLLTRLSGIPLLEQHGLKKWGNDPTYQQYLENTAVLVPFIW